MQQLKPDPLWDEGISTYLDGEYEKRQQALSINALQELAQEHAVRIGDILETLFLMVIYGEWSYTGDDGVAKALDEDALNELYAKGRLSEDDIKSFSGVWEPVVK